MPRVLAIEKNNTFSRISNKKISKEVQGDLYLLYKEDEIQVKRILDCIEVGWQTIFNKIRLEGTVLRYDVDSYTVTKFDYTPDQVKKGKFRVRIYYTYEDSTLLFTALV